MHGRDKLLFYHNRLRIMFTEMLSKFNIYISEITNVLNNTVQSISAILLVVLGVILKILWDYIKENREKQRNRADCLLLIRKEAWNKIDFLGYPQFTGCLTANFEASIKHYPPCLKPYEIKKLRDIDEMIWSEPLRVDNELSNFNSWREIYEKNEAALRPCIQDIGNSRT